MSAKYFFLAEINVKKHHFLGSWPEKLINCIILIRRMPENDRSGVCGGWSWRPERSLPHIRRSPRPCHRIRFLLVDNNKITRVMMSIHRNSRGDRPTISIQCGEAVPVRYYFVLTCALEFLAPQAHLPMHFRTYKS